MQSLHSAFSISWRRVANGTCSLPILPLGNWFTTITANGPLWANLTCCWTTYVKKYVSRAVKKPRRAWVSWTAKVSAGVTTVLSTALTTIRKWRASNDIVVVDKNGFLIAIMVTIACVHDGKAAYLLTRCLKELFCNLKVILADAGYRWEVAGSIKKAFGYALEIIVSGNKSNSFKPIGKRWIVERTFSRFDNYRRLCQNYEFTFDSAEEMVKLAAIRMLLNKI